MKNPPSANVHETDAAAGSGEADLPDLVRRFRAGDEAAFDEIVKSLTPRLHALAVRSLGSAEAAEEVVQDAWVRMYDRIGDVHDPAAFVGWAIRVTLNRIHDEYRARARERTAKEGLAGLRAAAG